MKKLIYIFLFALVCGQAKAQNLTAEQEKQAKDLVKTYCEKLSELCQKPNDTDTEPILQLFANRRVNTYNDLEQGYKELSIQLYLNRLSDVPKQEINIQFLEAVQTQPIEAVKNCGKTIANISLSKKIEFIGTKRTSKVTNNFYLTWDDKQWKIYGIGREVQEDADIESLTPFEVWQKTLKQLGGKGKVWEGGTVLGYHDKREHSNSGYLNTNLSGFGTSAEKYIVNHILSYTYKQGIKKIKFESNENITLFFNDGTKENASLCMEHTNKQIAFKTAGGQEIKFEVFKLTANSLILKVPNPDYNNANFVDMVSRKYPINKMVFWTHRFSTK